MKRLGQSAEKKGRSNYASGTGQRRHGKWCFLFAFKSSTLYKSK